MNTNQNEKPKPLDIIVYDLLDCLKYLKSQHGWVDEIDSTKYPDASEEYHVVWNYMVDTWAIRNGSLLFVTDWDLVYEDGLYAYTVPDFFKETLRLLMEEFGTKDGDGVASCHFLATW